MTEILVECPSGLKGKVRGLKAKELNILSDRKSVRSGEALDRLIQACWIETLDNGPYAFDGKPNWDVVLQADRFVTLMKIRTATYPEESYPFDVVCQNPGCSAKIAWEIDLDKDLPIKAFSQQVVDTLKSGKPFTTQVAGKLVSWKLANGADEKRAAKKATSPSITQALMMRITAIDGIDRLATERWLEELDVADCRNLLAEMSSVDGGVSTNIEIECNTCGTEQEVDLPFSAAFFMPPMDQKTGKQGTKKTRDRQTHT
jgi:hypothetical protein